MENQPSTWRYFRIDGEPPTYKEIHHGGRFFKLGNGSRHYRGGEVVWIDRNDPDTTSWPCLNCMAEDLGYREPPMTYWFKIPGSKDGEDFLPIRDEKEVKQMLAFVQCSRVLQLYIVGGGVRKKKEAELEDEPGNKAAPICHDKYIGNVIEDIVEEDGMSSHGVKDKGKRTKAGEKRKTFKKGKSSGLNDNSNHFAKVAMNNDVEVTSTRGTAKSPRLKQKARRIKKKEVERKYDTRFKGEFNYDIDEFQADGESSDSDDPTYEEIIDSDYELHDEDDEVLFRANVDVSGVNVGEWDEMGYEGIISNGEGEDSEKFESGESSSSSEDEVNLDAQGQRRKKKKFTNFREWNHERDLKNPHFELGMKFPSPEVFKDAVRMFSVLTKKELRFDPNDRKRVNAFCKTTPGCPFRIYASQVDKASPTMEIRILQMEHRCSGLSKKVYHCNAPFIAKGYVDQIIADRNWSREGMQAAVGRDYAMSIGYQMCFRAKKRALKLAEGTVEDQYNLLETYADVIKKANDNTSVWIEGDDEGESRRFKRMYICYGALKKGWIDGCRPIIGLDGCHLKTVYKGILLTAVGIDGNNGMYPIAFAIVEKENKEAWTWFVEFLKQDLELNNGYSYTFISDKQKGLLDAVKDVMPNAEHRHCARHLYNNFKGEGHIGTELRDLFWSTARSTTKTWFLKNMDSICEKSPSAWNWLRERPAEHWSRSHFRIEHKCDILLNNHCEAFNSKLLEARKMPILGFWEELRLNLMKRLANRRCAGLRWKCKVGPRIEKLLKKNAERSHDYSPEESSNKRFQVKGRGVTCASGVNSLHDVNLAARTCTCRR
ncbi:uncharacterized protein LOC112174404 isoform X2 [Rosa chinensis]|uniref:uncharacterized protein LOC112174404 isoform X2 n=1 Tax=Rosa chinensis TaxID=74649 RepID=UPI000D08BB56|nr:uncharacterized protein LOC112174404 isoform X2 [Rosa chinensis]XP_040364291.1 uncharacterized protein LOC112174404 isoform X2 [Rosa chinensis]